MKGDFYGAEFQVTLRQNHGMLERKEHRRGFGHSAGGEEGRLRPAVLSPEGYGRQSAPQRRFRPAAGMAGSCGEVRPTADTGDSGRILAHLHHAPLERIRQRKRKHDWRTGTALKRACGERLPQQLRVFYPQ